MTKICEQCGKEYTPKVHDKKGIEKSKYCSKNCSNKREGRERANKKLHLDIEGNIISKKCMRCKEYLPVIRFHADKRVSTKLAGYCKKCVSKQSRKRLYGLSDEYLAILDKAFCMVCKSKDDLHIDHCHTTKQNRGILCGACNTSLGQLEEDPERIRRLAMYADYCQKLKGGV